jgi:hypothetical protein
VFDPPGACHAAPVADAETAVIPVLVSGARDTENHRWWFSSLIR